MSCQSWRSSLAALLTNKLDDRWIRTTRRWTLVAWLFLSLGLILGGRWAYDVLGWGGYWAWDPVENASLVPWLILISGIHTLLIYKHTGHSLRATHLFLLLAFVWQAAIGFR